MHVLSKDIIKEFFEKNNIKLKSNDNMSDAEIDQVFINAANYGLSFVSFVSFGIFNAEQTALQTNYNSLEDLYDCYCNFIVGYAGNKC